MMSKFARGVMALVVLGALTGTFIQVQSTKSKGLIVALQDNEPGTGGGGGGSGGGGGRCVAECFDAVDNDS
jgi:hypothetical protein